MNSILKYLKNFVTQIAAGAFWIVFGAFAYLLCAFSLAFASVYAAIMGKAPQTTDSVKTIVALTEKIKEQVK